MMYEIREYLAMPGRFADVVDMFRGDLVRLFAKHDMEVGQVGMTTIGPNCFNELAYTLCFADLADMERKWNAFLADPEWTEALTSREQHGPLYQSIRRRVVDSGPFDGALHATT